jgi:hypothetical protein
MIKRKTPNQLVPTKLRRKIHQTLTMKNRKKPKKKKRQMIKRNRKIQMGNKKVNRRLLMTILMVNSHQNTLVVKNRESLNKWLLRNQPDNLNKKLLNTNTLLMWKCGQAFYPIGMMKCFKIALKN